MPVNEDAIRDYQKEAASALSETDEAFKSLVLPTGSGKTRAALVYAEERMEQIESVAYITQTDAHVKQVLSEASAIDVKAAHIPGKNSDSAADEAIDNREYNIQDYDAGYTVGIFSYPGYFHGSEVPSADVLIVDDAHAVVSQSLTYSAVLLEKNDWGRKYDRLLDLIKDQNPLLKSEIESLEQPVHRGGDTVLVPPPATEEIEEAIVESVEAMSGDSEWHEYLLSQRLNASRGFINWPCIITADTICWRPFILPFESLGREPHRAISESEIVALTSVKDSEFLQTRLGTPKPIKEVELERDVEEMGSRLVIPYREMYSHSPPSDGQINVIQQWAERFGSVLVSTSSDYSCKNIIDELHDEGIQPLRYKTEESIDKFKDMDAPRVLILVNQPSGIDIPSSVCSIAVHLDLPHSTSGHEVVAGDIEKSGTVAEASLAVRLSQLLGRLNRSQNDRSVHLLLTRGLPLRRGSVFVKSLDPAVLTDLLIGQRSIAREYQLPTDEELIDEAESFLSGDDEPRKRHIDNQQNLRERFLGSEIDDFSPGQNEHVEANLYAARGNFSQAAKRFASFSRKAEKENYTAHASFNDFQSLVYGLAYGVTTQDVLDRKPEAIIDDALSRNPPSGSLIAALEQMRHSKETDTEQARREMRSQKQRRQALYCFNRWYDGVKDNAPSGQDATDEEAWKAYWRNRLSESEHSELVSAYSEAFELLGTDTPQREVKDNDLSISWQQPSGEDYTLAIEVKGWNSKERNGPSDLKADHVSQARTNASKINADGVLLVTSRRGRERDVLKTAEDLGVFCVLNDAGIAFADVLASQCSMLSQIKKGISDADDVPVPVGKLNSILEKTAGGKIDMQEFRDLIDP